MIKINLLPSYIFDKQKKTQLMAFFGVLIVLTVGGLMGWKMSLDNAAAEAKMQADILEAEKNRIEGIKGQAQSERGQIQPMKDKITFFQNVETYNNVLPDLYQKLAGYTYKGVMYKKISPSNDKLEIDAYTSSLSDLGRYLLNMYRADSMFTSVTISAIPGYPASEGVPGVGPSEMPNITPTAAANEGMNSGEESEYKRFQASQQTSSTGSDAAGAYPGMSSYASKFQGLGAVASGVSKTVINKGFDFKVTCMLKTPITAPAPPGGGGAPGAPGAMPPPPPVGAGPGGGSAQGSM